MSVCARMHVLLLLLLPLGFRPLTALLLSYNGFRPSARWVDCWASGL